VLCTFGRAQRLGELTTLDDPLAAQLAADRANATIIHKYA
jgi:hypothetical protein